MTKAVQDDIDRERSKRTAPLDVSLSETLISEIIAMRHPPGSWLREKDIAARFGVSRSPVREALRHVAKAGFVQMHPWRGAQVVDLSPTETRHIFDLLEAIYGVMARVAAETIPERNFPEIVNLLKRCEAAVEEGTLAQRVAASFELGRRLGKLSASHYAFEMVIYTGRLAMWQHRYLMPDDLEAARRSLEIHRALVSAVLARDGNTAEWAARTLVAITRSTLIPTMMQGRAGPEND